jgi:hypothetical protein
MLITALPKTFTCYCCCCCFCRCWTYETALLVDQNVSEVLHVTPYYHSVSDPHPCCCRCRCCDAGVGRMRLRCWLTRTCQRCCVCPILHLCLGPTSVLLLLLWLCHRCWTYETALLVDKNVPGRGK